MVQIDFGQREVAIKIVYYGPALSGKTTNLQQIHQRIDQRARGRLMTLDTRDDRTLFFDLLPIAFRAQSGLKVKLKLYTVPGQVMHNSTRKIVLQGADGVAFVADSQVSETRANNEAYAGLRSNLREHGIELREMPTVIQFNKRDLPHVRSEAEIGELARHGKEPLYLACALRGDGVMATFFGLLKLTWDALDRKFDFGGKFGVPREEFLGSMCRHLGVAPDELEGRVL
ncbi:MAG TPA: gliding motility protein [Polyangia bacterium]|nr:gliding motility protein [Polyangia bacterium]